MVKESGAKQLWFPPLGFKSRVTPLESHQVHALVGGQKFSKNLLWFQNRIPMIMIHGALASRRYLMPTAKLLVKNMTVYILELPGHGSSSKPAHALSVEEQSSVISQWLNANKLKKVFVYANSYGCQIAAQLACDRPDVMAGLVLAGSTVDPSAPTMLQQYCRLQVDSLFEPLSAQLQLFADIADMGVVRGFETAGQMMRHDIKTLLPRINCRTLIVRGAKDPIAPQRWSELLAQMTPRAKLVVIPDAPHCVNYASPTQLSQILIDFVK